MKFNPSLLQYLATPVGQFDNSPIPKHETQTSQATSPLTIRLFLVASDPAAKADWQAASSLPNWAQDYLWTESSEGLSKLIVEAQEFWLVRIPEQTVADHAVQLRDINAVPTSVWLQNKIGSLVGDLSKRKGDKVIDVHVRSFGLKDNETHWQQAFSQGLEISLYQFKRLALDAQSPAASAAGRCQLRFHLEDFSSQALAVGQNLGRAVNLARHLVNLPAGILTPKTYSEFLSEAFDGKAGVKLRVYDSDELASEGLQLLRAVGAAATDTARLVHIRYRHPQARLSQPIAFVGKGVTFDSGGLDIKAANFMRLMKKDMGGSATVVGLAHWVCQTQLPINCDFWLCLAENAISANSFRPGDILISKGGPSVEIDNTDAEGRLVMADGILKALSQQRPQDQPSILIDVATLTGAMRVALGTKIGGLISNCDRLAEKVQLAGLQSGDRCWQMPLVQDYKDELKSDFADIVNSSASGFGGAITAALFLEKFVTNLPWAHLDVMAWNSGATGAWTEAGGNGQMTLCLARFLRDLDQALIDDTAAAYLRQTTKNQ